MTALAPPSPPQDSQRPSRLSALGITQISLGAIIGTGWLFGAANAYTEAGPAALISWFVGAIAMAILALVHAELGSMFTITGGSGRFAHYAFGTAGGYGIAWFAWITGAATVPIEVEGVLSYATDYLPWLNKDVPHVAVALGLLVVFTIINLTALRFLTRINNALTYWKVATILVAIVAILVTRFHPSNFHVGGFAPHGIHGIVSGICAGGVIFAFTGFEQAVQLGGETKNPGRNIPLALIASLGIVTLLYVGLQLAYIGALGPGIKPDDLYGPFAGVAKGLGLGWLAFLLYVDAVVSPSGNGIVYVTTTSRLAVGMARTKYVPDELDRNNKAGVPVAAVVLTFVVGVICLMPFPGWQTLLGLITSAIALMWAGAPLALGALRLQHPDLPRPFKLPAGPIVAPAAFAIANLVVYWSGWEADYKIFLSAIVGAIVFALSYLRRPAADRPTLDLAHAVWVLPWIGGLAIVSYLGTFSAPTHKILGLGTIPFGWDILVVVVLSVAVYALAMRQRLSPAASTAYIETIESDVDEEPVH